LFSLYSYGPTKGNQFTRLIINQINKVQWVDFKLENVLVRYKNIYSQLQVYVSRHMILVNFMFTPDEFGYKNNQQMNTLSNFATTRYV
jgi:hypothetical protein